MKQYCRYCTFCIYGDGPYCSLKEEMMSMSKIKHINNCEEFEFNPIDALDPDKVYKPRVKKNKNYKQQKLF